MSASVSLFQNVCGAYSTHRNEYDTLLYCDQLRFVRENGGLSPLSQFAYQVILTFVAFGPPLVEFD